MFGRGAGAPRLSCITPAQAGFTVTQLDTFYEKSAPKPWGAASLGVAVKS